MKNLNNLNSILVLSIVLIVLACHSPGEPDILLNKEWKVQSVLVDGADYTSSFSGMTLKFTDGKFDTTNGNSTWPSTGTWKYNSPTSKSIIRGDGVIITIEELQPTLLQLSFDWSQSIFSGRVNSIKGRNIFVFK